MGNLEAHPGRALRDGRTVPRFLRHEECRSKVMVNLAGGNSKRGWRLSIIGVSASIWEIWGIYLESSMGFGDFSLQREGGVAVGVVW